MDNETTTSLPEAPASITVKAYYKGYSVLLTRRGEKGEMRQLAEDAIRTIDWMAKYPDFNPSWNTETNGKHIVTDKDPNWIRESTAGIDATHNEGAYCAKHKLMMRQYTKDNRSWYSHNTDGEWCNGK